MRNKLPLMKVSSQEETFLRQWMYEEWHFEEGRGPAKRLQLEHKVIPENLATVIAAAIPDTHEQLRAAVGPPPPEPPVWPWTAASFQCRLEEARALLKLREQDRTSAA